jgi:nucleoside-diphosphate-sugar epimerase
VTAETAIGPRVLVVGGAGFVGSNLVRRLAASTEATVVIVDNFLSSERTDVLALPSVEVVEGSIADDAVLDQIGTRFETVFHLATYHGNQSSIADPLADHENNTLTTLKLFDRFRNSGDVRRIVYAGAGCTVAEKTYGEPRATREDDPVSLHLDSPYQISKVVGEMYASYYHARHGLAVVTARFQNVYGPWEILGAGKWRGTPETVWRNVTPTFIYKALTGQPLRLDNEGSSTRDFIFVDDIVTGLIRCAEAGSPGEAYNLASGVETSILELATTINANVNRPVSLELAPRRDWDNSGRRFGSVEKARATLGFKARVPLADGIEKTVAWTRENMKTIDSAIDQHRSRLARAAEPVTTPA